MDTKALDTELLEIIGHLGAAISQALPTDDPIILDHVKAAHEIARAIRRQIVPMPSSEKAVTVVIGDYDPAYQRVVDIVGTEIGATR